MNELPDGAYALEVVVNPAGRLAEVTRENNVAQRTIVLGTRNRRRTLALSPVGGVDTVAELSLGGELADDRL